MLRTLQHRPLDRDSSPASGSRACPESPVKRSFQKAGCCAEDATRGALELSQKKRCCQSCQYSSSSLHESGLASPQSQQPPRSAQQSCSCSSQLLPQLDSTCSQTP